MEMKNMTRSHLVLECCLLDWASAQSKASLQPLMSCSQVHLCWHLHKSWLAQSNKSNNRTPLGFRLAQQFLPVTPPALTVTLTETKIWLLHLLNFWYLFYISMYITEKVNFPFLCLIISIMVVILIIKQSLRSKCYLINCVHWLP